jgi:hypothetical protein
MRLIFEVLAGGWVIVLSLFMSPDALRPSGRELGQADDVVGGHGEGESGADLVEGRAP